MAKIHSTVHVNKSLRDNYLKHLQKFTIKLKQLTGGKIINTRK